MLLKRILWAAVPIAGVLWLLPLGIAPALAAPSDQGWIRISSTFGPEIVNDVECQEGTDYVVTGTEEIRIHFVDTDAGVHFTLWETHTGTAVPADGTGITYVESGNIERAAGLTNFVNGVYVFSFVNTDSFVAYQDGMLEATSTIRILNRQQFVAFDTDGDGVPDVVRVDITEDRFTTCP